LGRSIVCGRAPSTGISPAEAGKCFCFI